MDVDVRATSTTFFKSFLIGEFKKNTVLWLTSEPVTQLAVRLKPQLVCVYEFKILLYIYFKIKSG